ncbi:MAG: 50S ribosomal protein L3 [Myxococcota bacterium]
MKERKMGLLGKKIGMTRMFDDQGHSLGVTVLEVGPCVVLAKKTTSTGEKGRTDGYTALQLGFDPKFERKVNKAEEGRLKAAGGKEKARRHVREFRVSEETCAKYEVGQEIALKDVEFKVGDKIDIIGVSKGRGFQGVMKRHNFAGVNTMTHGTHEVKRHGGSIGCRKSPGRVFKGRKMPGHMGDRNLTVQNVKIVGVREEDNALLVWGSVPGGKNSYIMVRPAIKLNPLP